MGRFPPKQYPLPFTTPYGKTVKNPIKKVKQAVQYNRFGTRGGTGFVVQNSKSPEKLKLALAKKPSSAELKKRRAEKRARKNAPKKGGWRGFY